MTPATSQLDRTALLQLVETLTAQVSALEAEKLDLQKNFDAALEKAVAQQMLKQRALAIEQTYEAVHNGPLQSLAVLLRADRVPALEDDLRSQLASINQELRGIYQSMRLSAQDEALYLESGLTLDFDLPLVVLLQQVFEHTLARDFPGYETLQFQVMPDFNALANTQLSVELKRGVCLFLQEALCNVGKHALGTTRLSVLCEQRAGSYWLQIIDNGQTPGMIESLLQSLTESPEVDHQERHQGSRQAKALAQQLCGKFQRRPNADQGTICELVWPINPPGGCQEDSELELID